MCGKCTAFIDAAQRILFENLPVVHWAVNDGKMYIWERGNVHLRTANAKFQNITQKGYEQRGIPQSRQICKNFTQVQR